MGSSTFLRFIESDRLIATRHGEEIRSPFATAPLGLPTY
jgi:hypothetical protein